MGGTPLGPLPYGRGTDWATLIGSSQSPTHHLRSPPLKRWATHLVALLPLASCRCHGVAWWAVLEHGDDVLDDLVHSLLASEGAGSGVR